MTRVLATPELLECVLLHLDMRTLLVSAQRACRTWRELITTSPALQEALFFKPEGLCGTDTAKTRRRKGQGNDVVMPTDETADRTDDGEEQKNVVVRKNPLLASVFPAWFEDYVQPSRSYINPGAVMSSVSQIPTRGGFASQPFAAAEHSVLRYRSASWRRMLVQQPPARHVGEWQRVRDWRLAHGGFAWVRRASMRFLESGLRMGRLYDVTSEEVVRAATDRDSENVIQYVLWGPEGVRPMLDLYSATVPPGRGQAARWDLSMCAPREREGKQALDGLAAAADITILVYDKDLPARTTEGKIHEFCRKFICGPHSPRFIGKSWQEQPKGEQLWHWEK